MSTEDQTTCPEVIMRDWSSSVCGKPVKRDGLCGVHANAKDKRAAGDVKAAELRRTERAHEDELRSLSTRLGFPVVSNYEFRQGMSLRSAVVGMESLRNLADNRALTDRDRRALALGERLLRHAEGGSVDSLEGLADDARWDLVDMDQEAQS